MTTKIIISTTILSLLSFNSIGQEAQDMEKKKAIDLNTTKYVEQGGELPEKEVIRSPKPKEKQVDFIIHETENKSGEVKNIKFVTLEELSKYKDQTDPEYKVLKEKWILEHQLEYNKQNPVITAEEKQSIEDRKKKYNQH